MARLKPVKLVEYFERLPGGPVCVLITAGAKGIRLPFVATRLRTTWPMQGDALCPHVLWA